MRIVDGYHGPLVRVRLPDGREFDVYGDDPEIEVPAGAVRARDLQRLSGGGTVHVIQMPYDQSGSGRHFVPVADHELDP